MRTPTPIESLEGWAKARRSKRKIFIFCLFGFFVGVGVYCASLYLPVTPHLVKFKTIITLFEKIMGLGLVAIYGSAIIFFSISLFTNIWEKLCDYKIKKFQDKVNESTNS